MFKAALKSRFHVLWHYGLCQRPWICRTKRWPKIETLLEFRVGTCLRIEYLKNVKLLGHIVKATRCYDAMNLVSLHSGMSRYRS